MESSKRSFKLLSLVLNIETNSLYFFANLFPATFHFRKVKTLSSSYILFSYFILFGNIKLFLFGAF